MKQKNIETIVWIFCIFVIISLTIKITLESTKYDCKNCKISLRSYAVYGEAYPTHEESIIKLMEAYKKGHCLYIWDPTQGYIKNG